MIQQTILPFKIETTKERLTARGGLATNGGKTLFGSGYAGLGG